MKKILIANRGEIAVRVIRACRDMGIATVAVYSECDRAALHVRLADEAWPVGPNPPRESYLRIDTIVDVARQVGRRRGASGLRLPRRERGLRRRLPRRRPDLHRPDARSDRADGQQDRGAAGGDRGRRAGGAGHRGAARRDACPTREVRAIARAHRLSADAQGRRRRRRQGHADGRIAPTSLPSALRAARSEAGSAFGDSAVYLERRIMQPRHIEVQLLGDQHGTILPFVERECSHAAPPSESGRGEPVAGRVAAICGAASPSAAAAVARTVNYTNAGTIEFLLDEQRRVLLPRDEHAAAGRASDHRDGDGRRPGRLADSHRARREADARSRGAARRRAATPSSAASTPRIPTTASCRRPAAFTGLRVPHGPGVRDDSGAYEGGEVPIFYDPMISKLDHLGRDSRRTRWRGCGARSPSTKCAASRRRSRSSSGCWTTRISWPARFDTSFIDRKLGARNGEPLRVPDAEHEELAAIAAALAHASSRPTRDQSGRWRRPRARSAGWARRVADGVASTR